MRALILLGLVALAFGEVRLGHRKDELQLTKENVRIFEGVVKETIECMRQVLVNGDENTGLPPLDPITVDDLKVDMDQYNWEHFKGQFELNNFIAQGHFNWRISKLSIKPTVFPIGFKLNLAMEWDSASFQGDYDINTNILDHSIEGAGPIAGGANNFEFEVSIQGSLSKIKKISIKPSLGAINFEIGQLIVDGNDVSGAINGKVNGFLHLIQNNLELIGDKLSEALLDIINKGVYTNFISNYSALSGALGKCF